MRARSEETTVQMDYLEGLHEKHEDWLGAGGRFDALFDKALQHRCVGQEHRERTGA